MLKRIDKSIRTLNTKDIADIRRRAKLANGLKPNSRMKTLYRQLGTQNRTIALGRMLDDYNIYVDKENNRLARARVNLLKHIKLKKERMLLRKPQFDFSSGLKPYVNNWVKIYNIQNKAFEITLRSIRLDYQKVFEFKSINHFNNWIDHITKNEESTTSNGTIITARLRDIFRGVVVLQDIKIMSGGCSKHGDSFSTHISTFYAYETFSPISRDNNCLFACIKQMFPEQNIYLARDIRKQFNLESGSEVDINTAVRILKYLNLDIEILLFTEADELNKHQKYILYKNGHYRCVVSFTKIDMTKKICKRGLMTFDLETRKTDKCRMIGNTRAYELKDTICSVYYRDYKKEEYQKIIFTTDDESSSVRKFIDFLNEQSTKDKHYNIIAHNGGKFDFYFLIAQLTKFELSTSVIKLRGTTVIGMNIRANTFRDSFCYLTNSLKDLSINFDAEHGKQTEITLYSGTDNEKTISSTELCYYRPELSFNQFLELEHTEPVFWKAYCEYCMFDSMALFDIWVKFQKNIHSCIESIDPKMMKKCSLMKSMTIGGHSKTILKAINTFGKTINSYQVDMEQFTGIYRNKKHEIDDEKIDMEKYNFICKFKRGGISHCHKMGKHTSGTTSFDIKSQYPASLVFAFCPAGKSFWTDTTDDSIINGKSVKKYGFYLLKNLVFNESSKILKPISKSIKDESLDWATNDLGETYVDSYLLDYLKKNCGLETYEFVKGLVSHREIPMEKLFGKYVGEFYKLKALQDQLKNPNHKDHNKYNKAMRETIKLYLNSLTGKLVEDPSIHFQLEFSDEEEKLKINDVSVFKVHSETINNWIVAGVMVYSYSKRLLFEYINCLPNKADDIIHIETDGIYFPTRDLEQFKINLSNYSGDYKCCKLGDELGNVEMEHNTVDKPSWFLGKKFYCIMENDIVERPFENDKNIYRIKGVKQRTLNEDGKQKIIVDSTHYERIYKGETIPFTFSNLVSNLWGETCIYSYQMTRRVKPMGVYRLYE